MEIIKLGKKNDASVEARLLPRIGDSVVLAPLRPEDIGFLASDYEIQLDTGVYPGVSDVDAWACREASRRLNEEEK